MKVLVTGGAGYIGSHTVRALEARGHEPIVFDNLSRGHGASVLGAPFFQGDLLSPDDLARAFAAERLEAVLHFAALAYVGESVGHPDLYYRNNVTGTINLLDAMKAGGVDKLIFSSTCATYGDPIRLPMDEEHPQSPVNPYGRSKLVIEWVLRDYEAAFGIRHVALRYFNAAGCSSDGRIGEDHDPETHLIPRVLMAVTGEIPQVTVLGNDWDTPDGTCIRDYIHVEDLADAHVLALEHLARGGRSRAWNLGTGKGHSVREVIACAEKVTGKRVPAVDGPRRAGDPARLVAQADRVSKDLGWEPKLAEIERIVLSAWKWMERGGRFPRP
jgi:UDP-glucose-4-epimerase GalE